MVIGLKLTGLTAIFCVGEKSTEYFAYVCNLLPPSAQEELSED